jgi:hypothetical protein
MLICIYTYAHVRSRKNKNRVPAKWIINSESHLIKNQFGHQDKYFLTDV